MQSGTEHIRGGDGVCRVRHYVTSPILNPGVTYTTRYLQCEEHGPLTGKKYERPMVVDLAPDYDGLGASPEERVYLNRLLVASFEAGREYEGDRWRESL